MSRVELISRACSLLDALSGPPMGVTAISQRVGLPKSTTGRLLQALAEEGLVQQVPGGTDYRVGARVLVWAGAAQPFGRLVALARPHVRDLALRVGEAAGLCVPDGSTVNHLLQEEGSEHPVLVRDWTGARLPMHATAPGLVFLANMPRSDLDAYLGRPLEPLASRTVTNPAELRARLERVLADGYARTRDEIADGISSVAAPLRDASGAVAATVHVHWPTYRFPDPDAPAVARITEAVLATAAAVTAELRLGG